MFHGEIFVYQVERPAFFWFIFRCLGIINNFSTIFSTHSSNECILCLSYDLSCDEPASFCINFLLQFSPSELSITSGLFSSKINPCYNLLKCCSHSDIAMSDFLYICANWEINYVNKYQKLLFIGLSLCLIMSSNCSTFYIGNFCIVRNPFAIAFLYTNIWIVCNTILCFFFLASGFICALIFFPLLTQNHEIFWNFFKLQVGKSQKSMFWFDGDMLNCSFTDLDTFVVQIFLIRLANDVDIIFSVFCVINAGISDFPIMIVITAVIGVFVE